MRTYISLFSSAGVGCYGFKTEGFECIATNELIERRLNIQRRNNKCRYDSGYICGDITADETKNLLNREIEMWKRKEQLTRVDVVIATPPCQGMSVANHKKTPEEIIRNSLVVESIRIIRAIRPRFFVFENVPAFMKTVCTDIDGKNKSIADAISSNLGADYSFTARVINFKDYGACSSRARTVVIGVSKDYADEVSPYELYPSHKPERTLRDTIGGMRPLTEFGEIDPHDIYHSFRPYPEHMRDWISCLKEGESAFDNPEDIRKPHQIVNGELVINKRKNGDKYRRQFWNRVGPCVHTRNDQLASQNTIHPSDDRVFSIRELMRMMTVPDSFRWSDEDLCTLNSMSHADKRAYLKREEIIIRQALGEAVPTVIFQEIAANIGKVLSFSLMTKKTVREVVVEYGLDDVDKLIQFIEDNPLNLSLSALSRVAEMSNTHRTENAAFYTNKAIITEVMKALPDIDKSEVRILEPSAGVGNFIPLLTRRYDGKAILIDLVDIDPDSSRISQALLKKYCLPNNCRLNFIVGDFLLYNFSTRYDVIVGNPPFLRMKRNDGLLSQYQLNAINKQSTNVCSFFLDRAVQLGDYVAIIFPKSILNTPEFTLSREYYSHKCIDCIIDFGEKGFPGVLIETIALFINNLARPLFTKVVSVTKNIYVEQRQSYIFDSSFPYWVIYRNKWFDAICSKMVFGLFFVFRDRQITNSNTTANGDIRVLKSRNISDDGRAIKNIAGYDSYISYQNASSLLVMDFLSREDVYLTPNMTNNPRVIKKPQGILVNGSVAILIPKDNLVLSSEQLLYFSSEEYRAFYQIARNYQTRSLNVDACSVFFYGVLKPEAIYTT